MLIGLFVFLIEAGFGFYLGPLPVSEWFLYIFFIYKFNDFKSIFITGELKFVFKIFSLLLLAQLSVDLIHQSGYFYVLKGADSIIMSVLHMFFLYYYLRRNPKLLVYALVGACVTTLYSAQTLMGIDSTDYSDALGGSDAPLLKFIVAPIVSYGVCIASFVTKKNKWMLIGIFLLGLLFVVAGARSFGLILLITTIFILISMNKYISGRRLRLIFLGLLFVCYGGYVIYVNNVLNGNIVSGNNTQILELEDPYNPASLLIYGRPEVYVEAKAFAGSPLIGYSSHPLDKTGKYRSLIAKIKTESTMPVFVKDATIPAHSIVFDMGLFYGIFALLLMSYFTFKILKSGIYCLPSTNNIIALSFALAFILWNSFFSPVGHLKWTFPLFYVIILLDLRSRYNSMRLKSRNIKANTDLSK